MNPLLVPPKPIAEISEPTDRFKCVPYNAVLSARDCSRRQDMLGVSRNERSGDYLYCDGCPDGALVRLRLKHQPPPEAAPKPAHGPKPDRIRRRMPSSPEPTRPKPSPLEQRPEPARARSKATAPLMAEAKASAAQPPALPAAPKPPVDDALATLIAATVAGLNDVEGRLNDLLDAVRSTRAKLLTVGRSCSSSAE